VQPVVGDAKARARALEREAQVYTTNYDNLVWLRDHFKKAGKAWPFRTVVADESTKLKGFRLRQGGVRAQAIAGVAHKDVRRWINLTGTPASNGLEDLVLGRGPAPRAHVLELSRALVSAGQQGPVPPVGAGRMGGRRHSRTSG
jgi:hypothetical protein